MRTLSVFALFLLICTHLFLTGIAEVLTKHIATVDDHYDIDLLHKHLLARLDDPSSNLAGGDVKMHRGIRTVVVTGSADTCSELLDHEAIDHCERDSIVTAV